MIVEVEEIPLTANGKVNKAALPDPRQETSREPKGKQPPRNEREAILASIWAEVLRLPGVGINENFFELGGDSILSIQIIARARSAGLQLTVREMFEHQTIAELAAVARWGVAMQSEQGLVTGKVEMTPVQGRFFRRGRRNPNHFNQGVRLEVRKPVKAEMMTEALREVLRQHDALRMRFWKEEGEWKQENLGMSQEVRVREIDLREVREEEEGEARLRACNDMQRSLRLEEGRMVEVGLMEGKGGRQEVVIVIHHLVVDAVSWGIILEDLEKAYEQKERGEEVRLGEKTTSYKKWAEKLKEYARSEEMKKEREYWEEVEGREVERLPIDSEEGENSVETEEKVIEEMSEEETEKILKRVGEVYQTEIKEVIMSGILMAVSEWSGNRRVKVEMEGHGREEVIEGEDVTRTVGWFTSEYPVVMEKRSEEVGEVIKGVKEEMRRIPRRGIGYGVIRNEEGEERKEGREGEISVNYLGQIEGLVGEVGGGRRLEMRGEGSGEVEEGEEKRREMIGVTGVVVGGRLNMEWRYSRRRHRRESIERLAEGYKRAMRRIIEHCMGEEAGGYTPSDFPAMKFNQAELDALMDELTGDAMD